MGGRLKHLVTSIMYIKEQIENVTRCSDLVFSPVKICQEKDLIIVGFPSTEVLNPLLLILTLKGEFQDFLNDAVVNKYNIFHFNIKRCKRGISMSMVPLVPQTP